MLLIEMFNEPSPADVFLQKWDDLASPHNAYISLEKIDDGHVELTAIEVPVAERGKGVGAGIINQLTTLSDELGVKIILSPEPSNYVRLAEYYLRFGFVDYGSDQLVYEPA